MSPGDPALPDPAGDRGGRDAAGEREAPDGRPGAGAVPVPSDEPDAPAPYEGPGLHELPPHLRDRYDRPRGARAVARGRSQARLILLLVFAALPVAVLLVVVLNSLASGPPERAGQGAQRGLNEVTRFCVYSAPTLGDYDDCLRTTQANTIRALDTNAGRYARGELTRCLPDAGPRCTIR